MTHSTEDIIHRANRGPLLLLPFGNAAIRHTAFKNVSVDGDGEDEQNRRRVMMHLITKYLKLDDLATALQAQLIRTTAPVLYDEIALMLAETRAEQSLCKARYDALDADQPFADPGPAAENQLLDAIKTVDIAIQTNAAINALLEAAHGMIKAYAAKSTK